MPQASGSDNTWPFAPHARGRPFLNRAEIEAEIDRLIMILDVADGDPDDEDGGDAEPSLCAAGTHLPGTIGAPGLFPSCPAGDDREADAADTEPSLGSLGGTALGEIMAQTGWARGTRDDRELDEAEQCEVCDSDFETDMEPDREFSLGSLGGTAESCEGSQERWAGGEDGDRERDAGDYGVERPGIGLFPDPGQALIDARTFARTHNPRFRVPGEPLVLSAADVRLICRSAE